MPTHHEKIKISHVIKYPYKQVTDDVNELILLNNQGDEMATVSKMKDIVPEFLSKNSKFEHLDNNRPARVTEMQKPASKLLAVV